MSTPQQPETRSQMVGFPLSPRQMERLEVAATERGITVSDFAKGSLIATLAGGEAGEVYRTLGYFQAVAEIVALVDRGVKGRDLMPRLRAKLEAVGLKPSIQGEKQAVVQAGQVDQGVGAATQEPPPAKEPWPASPPMDMSKANSDAMLRAASGMTDEQLIAAGYTLADQGAGKTSPNVAGEAPQPAPPPASAPVGLKRGWAEEWKALKAMKPQERMVRYDTLRSGRTLPEGFAGWTEEKKIAWLDKEWPL